MAIDSTDTSFTITGIDAATGQVRIVCGCDGQPQTLDVVGSGGYVGDAGSLQAWLARYVGAYVRGLASVAVQVPDAVLALVPQGG